MAYIDSTTGSGSSGTPSTAVPTGAAIDDIVILAAAIDASGAAFDPADWPTGFLELAEVQLTLDGHRAAVGWKRLAAADVGSYTFNSVSGGAPDWVCQAVLLRGRHTTNPPVISSPATNNSSNASPVSVIANGVTALDGDDLLWISAPDVNASGIGNGHTPPSGYTEAEDAENAWSNLSGAYKENVSAGATGNITGTFALTSGAAGWAAFLIRIPAAAGGGGAPSPRHLALLGVGT